jgi:hypothetical protein
MQPPSESKPDPEFILSAEDHYLSLRTLYLFVNETRDKILSRLDSELASSIEKSLNKIEAGIKYVLLADSIILSKRAQK